jgi:hypothetical protein
MFMLLFPHVILEKIAEEVAQKDRTTETNTSLEILSLPTDDSSDSESSEDETSKLAKLLSKSNCPIITYKCS